MRLLRPAEAAARRLIIALALTTMPRIPALPPLRLRKRPPETIEPLLRSLGIAVTVPSGAVMPRLPKKRRRQPGRVPSFPLFDPLRRPFRHRRRYVPAHAAPRIMFPGIVEPFSLPPPPSRDDPIGAVRLGLRLAALVSALDDLPGQARRFARWRARRNAYEISVSRRFRRTSPLRGGRPPGCRLSHFDPLARRRSNIREIDEILAHAHALAEYALEQPDTS